LAARCHARTRSATARSRTTTACTVAPRKRSTSAAPAASAVTKSDKRPEHPSVAELLSVAEQAGRCRGEPHPLALQRLQAVDLALQRRARLVDPRHLGACAGFRLAGRTHRLPRLTEVELRLRNLLAGELHRLDRRRRVLARALDPVGERLELRVERRPTGGDLLLLALGRLPVDLQAARLLAQLAREALGLLRLLARGSHRAARLLLERAAFRQRLLGLGQRLLARAALGQRLLALARHPLPERLALAPLLLGARAPRGRVALPLLGDRQLALQLEHALAFGRDDATQLVAPRVGRGAALLRHLALPFGFGERRLGLRMQQLQLGEANVEACELVLPRRPSPARRASARRRSAARSARRGVRRGAAGGRASAPGRRPR
jgi:hypothetical protein